MSKFTYRCEENIAMRIKALRQMTGWSFQKMTDEFYKNLLYKLNCESTYFRDIGLPKQTDYVVKDIMETPSIKCYFDRRTSTERRRF